MKCTEISEANKKLQNLKEKFRYLQVSIDIFKSKCWDPYDNYYIDKLVWEKYRKEEIKSLGQILKKYEVEIRNQQKL